MKDKNNKKDLTYEEAIKRLEEIVRLLENVETPLEESLSYFQEGVDLSRYCREKLTEIEFRVEYLMKEEQQSPEGSEPGCSKKKPDEDDLL